MELNHCLIQFPHLQNDSAWLDDSGSMWLLHISDVTQTHPFPPLHLSTHGGPEVAQSMFVVKNRDKGGRQFRV